MTIDLSPETARVVREAVASGEFADASRLIEAVVRSWRTDRDDVCGFTADELDRLADEGEASGLAPDADFERILRDARREWDVSKTGK